MTDNKHHWWVTAGFIPSFGLFYKCEQRWLNVYFLSLNSYFLPRYIWNSQWLLFWNFPPCYQPLKMIPVGRSYPEFNSPKASSFSWTETRRRLLRTSCVSFMFLLKTLSIVSVTPHKKSNTVLSPQTGRWRETNSWHRSELGSKVKGVGQLSPGCRKQKKTKKQM